MKQKKINIITLGCSKNTVDSEKLIYHLAKNGNRVVCDDNDYNADIVIINTCGFILDAKEESINTVLKFVEAKNKGLVGKLYVMGCLSQRYGGDLEKEIPEVDKYFGVNSLKAILDELGNDFDESRINDRVLTGPSHYAYLKIAEGCNRKCAFCAIPGIRGKYISEPVEMLVKEAELLADKGVKELILVAQDLSYYGLDIYKKQALPMLVDELAKIDKIQWIRLHYLYPANFPFDLIDVINGNPKICRYIDIPIQHITDRMLSLMQRTHNRKETETVLYKLREAVPDAVFRTTLITGFPGETEADFRELCSFIKAFKFDRLGIFPYSHEDGTWAYEHYSDDVPDDVKQDRMSTLMDIQQSISLELNTKYTDKIIKVLVDRKEGDFFVARTEFDSPDVDQEVLIADTPGIRIGNFYNVRITSNTEFDLFAETV